VHCSILYLCSKIYHSRNVFEYRLSCVCVRMASDSGPPGSNYFILLILTDGIISDMQQTREAIVRVCDGIFVCLAFSTPFTRYNSGTLSYSIRQPS